MLKQYVWHGSTWQFEESKAPQDAVEIVNKKAEPNNKAINPKNKSKDAKK